MGHCVAKQSWNGFRPVATAQSAEAVGEGRIFSASSLFRHHNTLTRLHGMLLLTVVVSHWSWESRKSVKLSGLSGPQQQRQPATVEATREVGFLGDESQIQTPSPQFPNEEQLRIRQTDFVTDSRLKSRGDFRMSNPPF